MIRTPTQNRQQVRMPLTPKDENIQDVSPSTADVPPGKRLLNLAPASFLAAKTSTASERTTTPPLRSSHLAVDYHPVQKVVSQDQSTVSDPDYIFSDAVLSVLSDDEEDVGSLAPEAVELPGDDSPEPAAHESPGLHTTSAQPHKSTDTAPTDGETWVMQFDMTGEQPEQELRSAAARKRALLAERIRQRSAALRKRQAAKNMERKSSTDGGAGTKPSAKTSEESGKTSGARRLLSKSKLGGIARRILSSDREAQDSPSSSSSASNTPDVSGPKTTATASLKIGEKQKSSVVGKAASHSRVRSRPRTAVSASKRTAQPHGKLRNTRKLRKTLSNAMSKTVQEIVPSAVDENNKKLSSTQKQKSTSVVAQKTRVASESSKPSLKSVRTQRIGKTPGKPSQRMRGEKKSMRKTTRTPFNSANKRVPLRQRIANRRAAMMSATAPIETSVKTKPQRMQLDTWMQSWTKMCRVMGLAALRGQGQIGVATVANDSSVVPTHQPALPLCKKCSDAVLSWINDTRSINTSKAITTSSHSSSVCVLNILDCVYRRHPDMISTLRRVDSAITAGQYFVRGDTVCTPANDGTAVQSPGVPVKRLRELISESLGHFWKPAKRMAMHVVSNRMHEMYSKLDASLPGSWADSKTSKIPVGLSDSKKVIHQKLCMLRSFLHVVALLDFAATRGVFSLPLLQCGTEPESDSGCLPVEFMSAKHKSCVDVVRRFWAQAMHSSSLRRQFSHLRAYFAMTFQRSGQYLYDVHSLNIPLTPTTESDALERKVQASPVQGSVSTEQWNSLINTLAARADSGDWTSILYLTAVALGDGRRSQKELYRKFLNDMMASQHSQETQQQDCVALLRLLKQCRLLPAHSVFDAHGVVSRSKGFYNVLSTTLVEEHTMKLLSRRFGNLVREVAAITEEEEMRRYVSKARDVNLHGATPEDHLQFVVDPLSRTIDHITTVIFSTPQLTVLLQWVREVIGHALLRSFPDVNVNEYLKKVVNFTSSFQDGSVLLLICLYYMPALVKASDVWLDAVEGVRNKVPSSPLQDKITRRGGGVALTFSTSPQLASLEKRIIHNWAVLRRLFSATEHSEKSHGKPNLSTLMFPALYAGREMCQRIPDGRAVMWTLAQFCMRLLPASQHDEPSSQNSASLWRPQPALRSYIRRRRRLRRKVARLDELAANERNETQRKVLAEQRAKDLERRRQHQFLASYKQFLHSHQRLEAKLAQVSETLAEHKHHAEEMKKRNRAARVIQRMIRGFLVRRAHQARVALWHTEQREARNAAARTIQAAWRQHKELVRAAAVVDVQRWVRGWLARRTVKRMREEQERAAEAERKAARVSQEIARVKRRRRGAQMMLQLSQQRILRHAWERMGRFVPPTPQTVVSVDAVNSEADSEMQKAWLLIEKAQQRIQTQRQAEVERNKQRARNERAVTKMLAVYGSQRVRSALSMWRRATAMLAKQSAFRSVETVLASGMMRGVVTHWSGICAAARMREKAQQREREQRLQCVANGLASCSQVLDCAVQRAAMLRWKQATRVTCLVEACSKVRLQHVARHRMRQSLDAWHSFTLKALMQAISISRQRAEDLRRSVDRLELSVRDAHWQSNLACVVLVQAVWRGRAARRAAVKLRIIDQANCAATRMQAAWRGHSVRKQQLIARHRAAVRLQSCWRGYQVRSAKLVPRSRAAIKIQSVWRGHAQRQQAGERWASIRQKMRELALEVEKNPALCVGYQIRALSEILRQRQIGKATRACRNLVMLTNRLPTCCMPCWDEGVYEAALVFLQTCTRSDSHVKLLCQVLDLLQNLLFHPVTRARIMSVHRIREFTKLEDETPRSEGNSPDLYVPTPSLRAASTSGERKEEPRLLSFGELFTLLIELLQVYRDKSHVFTRVCHLLCVCARLRPAILQHKAIRRGTATMSRIWAIRQLLHRQVSCELEFRTTRGLVSSQLATAIEKSLKEKAKHGRWAVDMVYGIARNGCDAHRKGESSSESKHEESTTTSNTGNPELPEFKLPAKHRSPKENPRLGTLQSLVGRIKVLDRFFALVHSVWKVQ